MDIKVTEHESINIRICVDIHNTTNILLQILNTMKMTCYSAVITCPNEDSSLRQSMDGHQSVYHTGTI